MGSGTVASNNLVLHDLIIVGTVNVNVRVSVLCISRAHVWLMLTVILQQRCGRPSL